MSLLGDKIYAQMQKFFSTAAFSPTLSEDAGRGIYAIMKDGSRIKMNAAGMEPTALNAESPIILNQLDYVLLEDGTKLFANIPAE